MHKRNIALLATSAALAMSQASRKSCDKSCEDCKMTCPHRKSKTMKETPSVVMMDKFKEVPGTYRNKPCPCGSGVKAKKCDCYKFTDTRLRKL